MRHEGHIMKADIFLSVIVPVYNEEDTQLKVSLNAPMLFDASVQQILQLCFGHTLYIIPEETRLDTEKLLQFIRENSLDVFDCVPTQLKFLIEEGLLKENSWIPSKILPGGEAIDPNTWRAISNIEGADFFNMYGPTECTVDPTICHVRKNSMNPSIGKPIINVRHYVLNKDLQLVPIGVPGELFISGDCLSRGYFNEVQLTAQRFIPDPYNAIPGSRMYATGDLVKLCEDGNLEYLERIDDQIKLRGFRIELAEIDSILSILQMPGGIPVATMPAGKAGGINAALFAISILSLEDTNLSKKLKQYREGMFEKINSKNEQLKDLGYKGYLKLLEENK